MPASTNSVNPEDIESMEILKDASSAAIYGSNGGSGVVIITTKKGVAGKLTANLNYYHGIQTVANKIDVATEPEFGAMYTEFEAMKGLNTFTFPNYKSLPTYNYQDLYI